MASDPAAAAATAGSQEPLSILIATGNAGKVREFREMLSSDRLRWSDLSEHADAQPVEETGQTFRANACLKASGYARQFDTWALADDSGLEVDALNGAPGVYSARWAEMQGTSTAASAGASRADRDVDNNRTLLQQLNDVPDAARTARFVCVLALSDPQGRIILTVRDAVEGRMLRSPRGENGFGYDPLFLVEQFGKTTAELTPEQKHSISHRGKALRRMSELMERVGLR